MLSQLKNSIVRRGKNKAGREVPIYVFCYHKVGTVLMAKVFRNICAEFGWTYEKVFGNCDQLPQNFDVVFFVHSLVNLDAAEMPYVGIHLTRDPRDIIVSGYLYHKRCDEEWCLNSNSDFSAPILYPRVPYSQEHQPEEWKIAYLKSLNGSSYQQTLLNLDEGEGLLFEMLNYGAWTIDSMLDWNYNNPNVEEIKFEDLMGDFDQSFRRIFEHCGFSEEQMERALHIARKEDLNRMDDRQLEGNDHISSRHTTKWQKYFTPAHDQAFRERFGDALVKLGYETEESSVPGS